MSVAKLQSILERSRPLMDWYQKNRPEVKHVTLSLTDYQLLVDHAQLAPVAGIHVDGAEFSYRGFRLAKPPGFGAEA